MIRLTWRQFRAQAAAAIIGLAVLAVVTAVTGPHLARLYDTSIATCRAYADCPLVTTAFLRNDSTLRTWLGVLVIAVPGITGIFWGAPLIAREIETGTFRLAWPGPKASPAPAGWRSNSPSPAWPAWLSPGSSASWPPGGPAHSTGPP
ncbi:MAG: hypothetical protein ACRDPY_05900 [Streptosporangiaceae bacterium]